MRSQCRWTGPEPPACCRVARPSSGHVQERAGSANPAQLHASRPPFPTAHHAALPPWFPARPTLLAACSTPAPFWRASRPMCTPSCPSSQVRTHPSPQQVVLAGAPQEPACRNVSLCLAPVAPLPPCQNRPASPACLPCTPPAQHAWPPPRPALLSSHIPPRHMFCPPSPPQRARRGGV